MMIVKVVPPAHVQILRYDRGHDSDEMCVQEQENECKCA